jgi:hypothetical protein
MRQERRNSLIVRPENKEQLAALKALMKAFNISFEEYSSGYNTGFVARVQKGLKQIEKGKTRVVNVDEL